MFWVKKALNINIVQWNTLSNENITLVIVNKLKAYQNLIITITIITIITQDENKILPNEKPKKIISGRRTHSYECFKFNECRSKAQHDKNYNNEIITSLPKKWIRDHKQQKSDTTIHYGTTIKPILRTWVIPPNKPLWPLVLYLTHQENNYLWNLQQQLWCYGKLLLKENNYLNDLTNV